MSMVEIFKGVMLIALCATLTILAMALFMGLLTIVAYFVLRIIYSVKERFDRGLICKNRK